MPSDSQQTRIGYWRRTLISGSIPFLYRSRIRSLLGIPSARTNNVSAGTTIPPVGFRYQNQAFFEGRAGINQAVNAMAPNSALTLIPNESPGLDKLGSANDLKADANGKTGNFLKDGTENSHVSNISYQLGGASKSLESGPDHKEFSTKNMEIPGTSSKEQPYSPLVHSGIPAPQPAIKVKPDQHAEISIEKNIHDGCDPKPIPVTDSAKNIEVLKNFLSEPANGSISSPFQNTIPLKRKETIQPRYTQNSSYPLQSNANTIIRTRSETSDKIDKIRQTYHEIAKKQSAPFKEQPSGINQPSSPNAGSFLPPSPPVIIYKQRVQRTKIPSAFWERSYMSRINIRTLR
jgi:hypothetical protein